MNPEALKILGFTNSTASHIWRMDSQMTRMNDLTPHQMAIFGWDAWNGETVGADIVIIEMLASHHLVDTCHNLGAKVIYEADDAVLDSYGKERKNLMHVNQSFKSSAIETIRKCDAVTVPNETLAKHYAKYTDKPIYVIPILMDYTYYNEAILHEMPKRNTDEIRIGWFGSKGHFEDLKMVLPAIKNVLERDKRVKFIYCGYGGMESDNLAVMAQWGEDVFADIPRERREFHPGVPEEFWCMKHRFLDLDIGLCPLIEDNFNEHKEGTKWLEYSVLKTPSVVSPTVYGRYVKNGVNGLIANTVEDWENHIMALVQDENLRKKIGENASREVFEKYNVEDRWEKWIDVYKKVAESK